MAMSNILSTTMNPPRFTGCRFNKLISPSPPSSFTISLPHQPHHHFIIRAKEKSNMQCPSSSFNDPENVAEHGEGCVTVFPACPTTLLTTTTLLTKPASLHSSSMVLAFLELAPKLILAGLVLFEYYDRHKSMKKIQPSKEHYLKFDDVAGLDSAKVELLEIVQWLHEDSKYRILGGKVPKGVLLVGPPGVGKRLLARVVAAEASVAYFFVSALELSLFDVGMGVARVRAAFLEARKHSPSIIFIDEINFIGEESRRILSELLTEMDELEENANVMVMAATNPHKMLHPALMRSGRFSKEVLVGEPDEEGRRKIFSLYLRDVAMEEDKEAVSRLVAARTPGLVGADLENIANKILTNAAYRGCKFVTSDDVLQAVEWFKGQL